MGIVSSELIDDLDEIDHSVENILDIINPGPNEDNNIVINSIIQKVQKNRKINSTKELLSILVLLSYKFNDYPGTVIRSLADIYGVHSDGFNDIMEMKNSYQFEAIINYASKSAIKSIYGYFRNSKYF